MAGDSNEARAPAGVRAHGEGGRRASVLVASAGTAGLNVSTTAINFVLALALTRMLDGPGYGAYVYALAWATFLSVPASLGLTPLVIRYVASYAVGRRWGLVRGLVLRTHQVVLVTAFVLVGAGAGVAWLVHGSDRRLLGPFLIGLALVPLLSLTSLRQGVLKGFNRVVLGRVPETIVAPGLTLALVGLVWWARGRELTAEWAVGLTVAAVLIAFLVGTIMLRLVVPREARAAGAEYELRQWSRSAVPLLAIALLLVVNAQVGTILLGSLADAQAAGVFSIAVKVSAFTSFFYLAATYPLYPSVARLWASGDTPGIDRLLTRTSRAALVGAVLVGGAFLVFGGRILEIFGSEYARGGLTALRILTVAEIVKVAVGYGGLALIMTPFERSMLSGMVLGVALNAPLAAALVPVWGVDGAAVASAAGAIGSSLAFLGLARRRLGIYGSAFARRGPARR